MIDGKWDLIIAHPPCTYLSNVATRHHSMRCAALDKINERTLKRIEAMCFFMRFATADCEKIAIENPVGVMNTAYRKPDQIIHPYEFAADEADPEGKITKATCLWLKNLAPLVRTNAVPEPSNADNYGVYPSGKAKTWEDVVHGANTRSVTFYGVARAMADQWG